MLTGLLPLLNCHFSILKPVLLVITFLTFSPSFEVYHELLQNWKFGGKKLLIHILRNNTTKYQVIKKKLKRKAKNHKMVLKEQGSTR